MRKSMLLIAALVLSFFATPANAQIKAWDAEYFGWSVEILDCDFEALIEALNLRLKKLPYNDGYTIVSEATHKLPTGIYGFEMKNCKIRSASQSVFWHDGNEKPFTHFSFTLYSTDSLKVTGIDKFINFRIKLNGPDIVSKKVAEEIFSFGKISLRGFFTFDVYHIDKTLRTPQNPNDFSAFHIDLLAYKETIQAGK